MHQNKKTRHNLFSKLRKAFSNVVNNINVHGKEVTKSDIDNILSELEISLLESDVAVEIVDLLKKDLYQKLTGIQIDKSKLYQTIKNSLIQNISSLCDSISNINIISLINSKKKISHDAFVIMFVGINGTGKTTTLAKINYLLKKSGVSTVIAASDTYRAGAIEQLQIHANKLNTKLIHQNYGSDPASVARDAILYANSHNIDCVLIDTAGRMQNSKNLMDQISKIVNVTKPDLKLFVGDSLAGNDVVNQAQQFYDYITFDASILTKADADSQGGSALSIMKLTCTPIIYFGTGQSYNDLKQFNKNEYISTMFPDFDQTKSIIPVISDASTNKKASNSKITSKSNLIQNNHQIKNDNDKHKINEHSKKKGFFSRFRK